MNSRTYKVLFLCTGNSARSILAECILRALGYGNFHAFSAGSHPRGIVHPLALRLLREQGLSTRGLRSKSWDEFAIPGAPAMDFVFTVCDQAAGELCPAWPGHPVTAHWGIPDPAAVPDDRGGAQMLAFRDAFRALERRIKLFVALPFTQLDRVALQQKVDGIGRLRRDNAEDRAS
jgi:arsenate reductase (thioredoxin)